MKDIGARIISLAIGLGLTLGAATQLRFGLLGPGEILLVVIWMASLIKWLTRKEDQGRLPLQANYTFVVLTVVCWSWIGLAISQDLGTTYESWLRQWFALLFAVSFPIVIQLAWGKEIFIRSMGAMSIFALLFYLFAWMMTVIGIDAIGQIHFIKFDYRFVGFSSDPNQAVMLISVAMFSAVIVGLRLGWSKWGVAGLLFVAVLLGRATDSDSFFVAFGLALLIALWEFGFDRERKLKPISVLIVTVVGVLGLVLVAYGIYTDFDALYEKNTQGAVRMRLWAHGIEAFLAAPLSGHGPGHFSGWIDVFGKFEAHNLYIDWAAQFGVVGLIVLVALFVRLGVALLRAREFAGLGMLAILAILSTFLFFGRHAVFWSGLYLCMVLLATSRKPAR